MADQFAPIIPPSGIVPWSDAQATPARPTTAPRRQGRGAAPGTVPISDAHHYARLNGSLPFPIPLTSVQVLAAPDGYRNFFSVRNASATANILIEFGNDASLFSVFRLIPNQILLLDVVVPQDDVYAIADAAGGILSVSFSNTPG